MASFEQAKLLKIRAELVRKYRANPQVWPDGIGSWFKSAEWPEERIEALLSDRPWPVNAVVNAPPVNTPVNTQVVNAPLERVKAAARPNMAAYMRERRAAAKAKP